jgi:hypothetical protein
MKKSETPTKQREEFLPFTEAAKLLGSGNHTRIAQLVKQGILPAYTLPLTDKLRVRKSDVFKLAQPTH